MPLGVVVQKRGLGAAALQRPPAASGRQMTWMGTWTSPCIINKGVLARMIMPAARAVDVCAEQGKDKGGELAGAAGRARVART